MLIPVSCFLVPAALYTPPMSESSDPVAKEEQPAPPEPAGAPVVPYASAGLPVLPYASAASSADGRRTVVVSRGASGPEAALLASALNAAGIEAEIINHHTDALRLYVGGTDVKLLVMAEDAERAAEVIRLARSDEVEPADADSPGHPAAPAPVDDDGRPVSLVPVAAFDHVRPMRAAATVLSSARIDPFPPTLVARGDRPPGTGKRFVLRVREDDLERARAVLEDAEAEAEEEDDPQCPKCGSHRVYPFGGGILRVLARMVGFGGPDGAGGAAGFECLACKYRGPAAEFGRGGEG